MIDFRIELLSKEEENHPDNFFCTSYILGQFAFQTSGLDIQDDLGRHDVGFVENTDKFPLNNNEGCRFEARFQVNKVGPEWQLYNFSSVVGTWSDKFE